MRYCDEEEIREILHSFENVTVARENWKHAEHLTVALCYVTDNDLDTAYRKMRSGIFKLLNSFGVDLAQEMPYHETLTVFWLRTVFAFSQMMEGATLVEKANGLVELFDKDYPLRFYGKELLFSAKARTKFVEPDENVPEFTIRSSVK